MGKEKALKNQGSEFREGIVAEGGMDEDYFQTEMYLIQTIID